MVRAAYVGSLMVLYWHALVGICTLFSSTLRLALFENAQVHVFVLTLFSSVSVKTSLRTYILVLASLSLFRETEIYLCSHISRTLRCKVLIFLSFSLSLFFLMMTGLDSSSGGMVIDASWSQDGRFLGIVSLNILSFYIPFSFTVFFSSTDSPTVQYLIS